MKQKFNLSLLKCFFGIHDWHGWHNRIQGGEMRTCKVKDCNGKQERESNVLEDSKDNKMFTMW